MPQTNHINATSKEGQNAIPEKQLEAPPTPPQAMPNIAQNQRLTYQIFQTENPKGFGYDILLEGKKFLHQPNIPAINGNKAFQSQKDAEKIAALVVFKISKNMMPPSISVKELDSLKIVK